MESLSPISFVVENKLVLTVIAIANSYYFLLRRDPRVKFYLDSVGGPRALPVFGKTLQLLIPHDEVVPLFGQWAKEHGHTYRLWFRNFLPYVFTWDVKLIEKIITSPDYLEKGKYDYSLLMDWLGTGLLTAPASKWSIRRKMLTPSFHFKILEDFLPIFNEQADVMLECLGRDGWDKNGKIFNMYPYIIKCTLDIICETAMGKKINAQTDPSNKEYINAVNGLCILILDKWFQPWLRIPIIYNLSSISTKERHFLRVVKGFTQEVIQARKLERKQCNALISSKFSKEAKENLGLYGIGDFIHTFNFQAFLDLLLDTADTTGDLNDADICEEVDTFMFEGHDTTAVNLAWTILLLAMHPECQKLVQNELDEIVADNATRDITATDLSKMKYLECCLKESLRLYPSVPWFTRQVNTDITLERSHDDSSCDGHDTGKIIPKGATVLMGIYYVHRLAEHFPEPLKFIPERFSNEMLTKRHPYAFISFSASSRNCIGQKFAMMEEKIILAKLFRNFSVETEETGQIKASS